MRNSNLWLLPVIATVVFVSGCGGTSRLQTASGVETNLDLSGYKTVVVGPFADKASEKKTFKNDARGLDDKIKYTNDVKAGAGIFAEYLVAELSTTGAFESVSRGDSVAPGELFIDGDITRYNRGSSIAKYIVGLGVGSTYFDAIVRLHDGPNTSSIGQLVVDKNSWVMGGPISAAQSIEGFIRGAAKKTASEIRDAKLGIVTEN